MWLMVCWSLLSVVVVSCFVVSVIMLFLSMVWVCISLEGFLFSDGMVVFLFVVFVFCIYMLEFMWILIWLLIFRVINVLCNEGCDMFSVCVSLCFGGKCVFGLSFFCWISVRICVVIDW